MMKHRSLSVSGVRNLGIVVAIASLIFTVSASAAGPAESTLYNFLGHPDGSNPGAPVTFDKAGNIFGTTRNGGMSGWGTIFELSPSAIEPSGWSENILYSFEAGSDGANPSSGVVFDQKGALYGEVLTGSVGQGDVYELTPPTTPGGSWTESTPYLFCVPFSPCPDGSQPSGGLVFDRDGNLYGTTSLGGLTANGCCGIVFKLTKPHGSVTTWTQTVLYTFLGFSSGGSDGSTPMGGVILDKEGHVYGTTLDGGDAAGCGGTGCGTVFELSEESGVWKERILHTFHGTGDGRGPESGLIFDECGALYGTTSGDGENPGNVFKLRPPTHSGGTWKESVLYRFRGLTALDGADPQAGVVFRGKDLYGTTAGGGSASCSYGSGNVGCGTIFKLEPPKTGTGPWHETILWNFPSGGSDPIAPLIVRKGALYGTASDGGGDSIQCQFGCGAVFELVP
ncbi:MAG: choice-of-anchor tandem repeat GloVer-containing protein [Candidatus Sulfotelmatobacter sp.]